MQRQGEAAPLRVDADLPGAVLDDGPAAGVRALLLDSALDRYGAADLHLGSSPMLTSSTAAASAVPDISACGRASVARACDQRQCNDPERSVT